MKKKYVISIVAIAILFTIYNVGFQCGNVRVGKQKDLVVKQNFEIAESPFYKNYFKSNKLIVVNMWATWCKPCLAEVPLLNTIKESYANDSIIFLSLSVDDDSVRLNNYIKQGDFKFKDITMENIFYRTGIINLLNGEALDKHIMSYVVPKTYLIKNQKVQKVIEGGIEKEELVAEINKLR